RRWAAGPGRRMNPRQPRPKVRFADSRAEIAGVIQIPADAGSVRRLKPAAGTSESPPSRTAAPPSAQTAVTRPGRCRDPLDRPQVGMVQLSLPQGVLG